MHVPCDGPVTTAVQPASHEALTHHLLSPVGPIVFVQVFKSLMLLTLLVKRPWLLLLLQPFVLVQLVLLSSTSSTTIAASSAVVCMEPLAAACDKKSTKCAPQLRVDQFQHLRVLLGALVA